MEEELTHIDQIDRYLNEELRPRELELFRKKIEEDAEFAHELEVYEKIYAGIRAQGDINLRKRLDNYYADYLEDHPPRSKTKIIRMIVTIGIAASIILGVSLFFFNRGTVGNPDEFIKSKDNVVVSDTAGKEKKQDSVAPLREQRFVEKNVKMDSLLKQQQVREVPRLSMGEVYQFKPWQIKEFSYPSSFSYAFNGNQLLLYGDPLIPALSLKVLKTTQGSYLLKIKNTYYTLHATESVTKLKKTDLHPENGRLTDEKITITIQDISSLAKKSKQLEVIANGTGIIPQYRFDFAKNKLILSGTLDYDKAAVFLLKINGTTSYFLKIGTVLYVLDPSVSSPKTLRRTDVLKNNETRLFRKRDQIVKAVYAIKGQ